MRKTMCLVVLYAVALTFGTAEAEAQTSSWTDRGFATVSLGGQLKSREFNEVSSPAIYGENGLVSVPHTISDGVFVDISGGMRVWKNLAVGLGFSHFANSEDPTLVATIPNPLFINSPRTVTASTGPLSHSETSVQFQLVWMITEVPALQDVEVAVILGPSVFNIKQDFAGTVTPSENAPPPFGTVAISSVDVVEQSKNVLGLTAGLDATYRLTRQLGVGGFVRFSGAKADMTTPGGGSVSMHAGGFQVGAGVRARF